MVSAIAGSVDWKQTDLTNPNYVLASKRNGYGRSPSNTCLDCDVRRVLPVKRN
jgi:hypothetical protein